MTQQDLKSIILEEASCMGMNVPKKGRSFFAKVEKKLESKPLFDMSSIIAETELLKAWEDAVRIDVRQALSVLFCPSKNRA